MKNNEWKNEENLSTKVFNEILEWAESFVFAIFIVILIFIFLFRTVLVQGSSMFPTLKNNDRLIISHLNYTPEHGDIIVVNSRGLNKTLIKRCIGVAGDVIRIDYKNKTLTRNGELLTEDYINEEIVDTFRFDNSKIVENETYEYIVPDNKLFVLGDNRNHSDDSRSVKVGFIDTDDVLGKAIFRIMPFGSFGKIRW